MTKNELKKYVEALIAAPSCCPEAKDAGEKYLAMLGSDAGKQFFGEEKAAEVILNNRDVVLA